MFLRRKGKKSPHEEHGRHICTLDTEDANAFLEYDLTWENALTISANNPGVRQLFRSLTLIEQERQRYKKVKSAYIIHPLSLFRLYWEIIQVITIYLGMIIIPVNFIYGPHRDNFGFNMFWQGLEILFDLLYTADIVMRFFTGYMDAKHQEIHLQYHVIAKKYLTSFLFYVDLVCNLSVMFILILFSILNSHFLMNKWVKLIGAIKMIRLIRFLEYLENVSKLLRHYYYSRVVILYVSLMALGLHWLTCLYINFLQSTQVYANENDYVLNSFEFEEIIVYDYWFMYLYAQNMVVRFVMRVIAANNFSSLYNTHVYSEPYILIFIVYSSIGFVVDSLYMILILQLILSLNATESKYHSIMSQLVTYMQLKTLPPSMRERFICYYEYRFQKNYFREATILGMLSETLRHEINLYSCRSLIESVSILRDLPAQIISEVVFHLKHEVYLYNDVIVKAATVGDCMYFIANGSVAVLTPTGREICHLQDGSYFGEIALISENQKRTANVVAIEICEVYRLDREDFHTCFQKNTMFFKKIQQTAKERQEKTVLLEELHKKYVSTQQKRASQNRSSGLVEFIMDRDRDRD